MKNTRIWIISVVLLTSLACQTVTRSLPPSFEDMAAQATPTLEPVTEKSLAGLIISSPEFGLVDGPYMGGLTYGLGMINEEGQLIQISGPGIYSGHSPDGQYVIYQSFDYEYPENNLHAFDVKTGEVIELVDRLDGIKRIVSWDKSDASKFIYFNDLEGLLFEAYGYFEGMEVLVADINTSKTSQLFDGVFQIEINPDQTRLAYTTGEIIYTGGEHMRDGAGCFQPMIYDLSTGSNLKFDTSQLAETPLCLGYPNWSPDGKWIAWIGYFPDDKFRPVIFNNEDGTGKAFDEIDIYADSQFPGGWGLYNQYPDWIDESVFWMASYEINVQTGEVSAPREISDRGDPYVTRPDGRLHATLRNDGVVAITDEQFNELIAIKLNDLYAGDYAFDGEQMYASYLKDWSPSAPRANIIGKARPTATDVPAPSFSCPGAPRTRLQVGETGRVTFTDGQKSILRSSPETEAGDNSIDRLPEGTEFVVIGGPVCYKRSGGNGAFVFWEIRIPSRNDRTGWVAEGDISSYFLQPWP